MKPENEINKSIAFIQHDDKFFQILNEEQTDWDEILTREAYNNYLLSL